MAKYLKKFQTTQEYEAAESGLILPNVSLITDNNTVHYNPSSPVPPTPSHDYVEIAGIKWATMNIGANSVTDTGLYFSWGDTSGYTASQVGSGEGQKYFSENDYIYYNDGSYTKYNSTDGKTVLEASDDAVKTAWGDNWRMPTTTEFAALRDAVTTAWTTNYLESGVAGMICTDNTDNSKVLFFPACGSCSNGRVNFVGSFGYYWSSSLNSDAFRFVYSLYFLSSSTNWQYENYRYGGYSVRGVLDA